MKKLLSIALVALLVALSMPALAQEKSVMQINVPEDWDLRDKIILVNQSPYTIIEARIAWVNGNEMRLIGSCKNVLPNEDAEMVEMPDDGLALLRGKRLILKIKARLPHLQTQSSTAAESSQSDYASPTRHSRPEVGLPVADGDPTGQIQGSLADQNADSIDGSLITYEYEVLRTYERKHDLYIQVTNTDNASQSMMDF